MQCVWFLIYLVCQSKAFILETLRDNSGDGRSEGSYHGRNKVKTQIQFGEGNIQAEQRTSQHVGEPLPSKRQTKTHRINHTLIIHEGVEKKNPQERHRHENVHIQAKEFIDKYAHHFNKKNNVKHGGINNQVLLSETESEINGSSRIETRVQVFENKNQKTYPGDRVFTAGADINKHGLQKQSTEPNSYDHFTKTVRNNTVGLHQSSLKTGDTIETYKKVVTVNDQNGNGETKHVNTLRGDIESSSGCTNCPKHDDRKGKEKEDANERLRLSTYEEITSHRNKMVTETAYTRHPGHKNKHPRSHRHSHSTISRHDKIISETLHGEHAFINSDVQIGLVAKSSDKKYKHSKFYLHNYDTSTKFNQFKTDTVYKRNTSKPQGAKTGYIAENQVREIIHVHVAEITDRNSSSFRSTSVCILVVLSSLLMILNS